MPGTYVREIKPWAKGLLAAVTVARRVTGTTIGASLISFAIAYGFRWAPKVTVPENAP